MTQAVLLRLNEPEGGVLKEWVRVTHRYRVVGPMPESLGIDPRNWHFKQIPMIFLITPQL